MTKARTGPTATVSETGTECEGAAVAQCANLTEEKHGFDAEKEPHCEDQSTGRRSRVTTLLTFAVLPALALLLALAAGYLKWTDSKVRGAELARIESLRAATESTVALLSYRPDTAEKDLVAARDRLTGAFRDTYTSLTSDVVIPGAKQEQISAVATVPAAASLSASENHAAVLIFVNQTTIIGNGAPTDSASAVRVALDKVHDRWLISQFEPV